MIEQIEIRSTGEVLANYLQVGKIEFLTHYPRDLEGQWSSVEEIESVDRAVADVREELEGEVADLESEVENLRGEIDAEKELRSDICAAVSEIVQGNEGISDEDREAILKALNP